MRDRVADVDVLERLDRAPEVTDLAGAELLGRLVLGREDADLEDLVGLARRHELDVLARFDLAVDHSYIDDNSLVIVVRRVDHERAQRSLGIGVALGRRDDVDDPVDQLVDARARLARDPQGVGRIEPEEFSISSTHSSG